MYKHYIFPLLKIIFLCFFTSFSFGQHQKYDPTKIDSLSFTNNRKLLNSLNTDKFQKGIYKSGNATIPYRLLSPKHTNEKTKYPLVITFHNSSRIGDNNEDQLEPFARIWLRDEISEQYPCYVLAPQFSKRSSNYETDSNGVLISKPSEDVFELLKLIGQIEKEYPDIDQNKIYLIGYSMGASTAQNLMCIEPDKFAAMVSVAAVPDLSALNKFKGKNIWLIHGTEDQENPYAGSVELYHKLKGNKNLIFTTFTYLQHNNIVIPFLTNDKIQKWLFKQRKHGKSKS
ncbi:alpha/beta fold hydrolase [Pedobacter sp.]|uniref:carboxylesterase family protein n=1 Tax=Pedobacter sp. TaxID=1411316 RepID=UPI00396C503D